MKVRRMGAKTVMPLMVIALELNGIHCISANEVESEYE